MNLLLTSLPKNGDKIYTINRCKIEEYYVESIDFHKIATNISNKDLNQDIIVKFERYNDNVNSYKTERRLSDIFLTKEELIKQL